MYDVYLNGRLLDNKDKKLAQQVYGLPDDSNNENESSGSKGPIDNMLKASKNKSDVVNDIYNKIASNIISSSEVGNRSNDEISLIKSTLASVIIVPSDHPDEVIFLVPKNDNEMVIVKVSKIAFDYYYEHGNKEDLIKNAGRETEQFGAWLYKNASSKMILTKSGIGGKSLASSIANTKNLGRATQIFGTSIKLIGGALSAYDFASKLLNNSAPEQITDDNIRASTLKSYSNFMK